MPAKPPHAPTATVVWFDVPCKVYTGTLNNNGYSHKHRPALEARLGRPIRPGYQAAHHCDNRACYEPTHLFEATQVDNERDKHEKHGYPQHMQPQKKCPNGHAFSEENTYTYIYRGRLKRRCRPCANERQRGYRASE